MKSILLLCCLFCLQVNLLSQETGLVNGRVTGSEDMPVFPASIAVSGTALGTVTDENGRFSLRIPAGRDLLLVISHLGYEKLEIPLRLEPGQTLQINRHMVPGIEALDEVTIREHTEGSSTITRIDAKTLDMLPNISGNLESILLTLPGVSSRSELSSQYSVRGGNFDENLVYVNGIEVHRPFLIRSGQQEGLSFINPDMVSSISFSAGGFGAMYGDKMSSVLDISYRRPVEFGASADLSLLGASAHLEGISADRRFTHTSGIRYKTSRYLLGTLETSGEYHPNFLDFQSFLTYRLSPGWELSLLANIASNRYNFVPETRNTDFGTYNNPLNLLIYFDGQEKDRFDSYTGALSAKYSPHRDLSLRFTGSGFNSVEEENYDILGQYLINELDNRFNSDTYGDSILNIGIGTLLNHARNNLNAFVWSFSHAGTSVNGQHTVRWGFRWQNERIFDRISEWELIDSAGYAVPYSGTQITLNEWVRSSRNLNSMRLSSYIQHTYSFGQEGATYYLSGGLRASWWDMNKQFLMSPRINFSVRPEWEHSYIFRFAAGYYQQPPFYRELRYPDGSLNTDVRAQRSVHIVLGGDYEFYAWERPFKFTTEIYYKHLDRLIPYKMDNLRIDYAAENMARGYAAGIDLKIHGEFVPGADSWASLSFMKTVEDNDRDDAGYYPRPTDQRMIAGIFFRDYLPQNPDYKVNLNLLYGTGLPFSPPGHDRYDQVFRMPAYKRVDIGFSRVLKRNPGRLAEGRGSGLLKNAWISGEIFNLLGVKNTISYLWIKTVSNQDNVQGRFAVPNYLTGRRFNLRISVKF